MCDYQEKALVVGKCFEEALTLKYLNLLFQLAISSVTANYIMDQEDFKLDYESELDLSFFFLSSDFLNVWKGLHVYLKCL